MEAEAAPAACPEGVVLACELVSGVGVSDAGGVVVAGWSGVDDAVSGVELGVGETAGASVPLEPLPCPVVPWPARRASS